MKNTSYILSYVFTLIVGILLLVYNRATNIFEIIIMVIGGCFIIPSLIGLFMGFSGKKNPDGSRTSRPWYVGASSVAGLVGGVLLMAMPEFFVHYLIYTFGVIMIVAGIIQILFLSGEGRDIGGMPGSWYILPWLTVAAGIAVIIIGPEKIAQAATIVTGIVLTLYSVNGLLSATAHKVTRHRIVRASAAAEAATIEAETPTPGDSSEENSETGKGGKTKEEEKEKETKEEKGEEHTEGKEGEKG